MSRAAVAVSLEDGDGTYVNVEYVDSLDSRTVCDAAARCLVSFVAAFVRDEVERGETWDPLLARKRHDSIIRGREPK